MASMDRLCHSESPKRIAIVTRRFWPMSGSTAHFAADLADFFVSESQQVRLFTAAWQKDWPQQCSFRNFDIQRLPRPASGPWGTYRYQRALVRELEVYQPDAVLLFDAGEDLVPVRKLVGEEVPCVVRVDHRGLSRMSRLVQKSLRLELATAILCDSLRTRNELVLRRLAIPKTEELVSAGVSIPEQSYRSVVRQAHARAALGDAHPVLRIDPARPLVVTAAPMDGDAGLEDLVRAWTVVLELFPKAKLWLLGDGAGSQKVWDRITNLDMVYSAIMPGYFDDLEAILTAADLYVHPLREPVNCRFLMEAIAAGVCPVVTSNSSEPFANRDSRGRQVGELVEFRRDENAVIAPAANPNALGEAISMALHHSDLRVKLGNNARESFQSAIDLNGVGRAFLSSLRGARQPQDISGAPQS